MKYLVKNRNRKGLSQRGLADLASVSFRTVQLLESGNHDPKLSTLKNIAKAYGYPNEMIERYVSAIFEQSPDSISVTAERIFEEGEESWKLWLFNFVDAFRRDCDRGLVEMQPFARLSDRMEALFASTVESLCDELKIKMPAWCRSVFALKSPWFVAGIENLKAISIVESPIYFRKRNIFVLDNFLSRR